MRSWCGNPVSGSNSFCYLTKHLTDFANLITAKQNRQRIIEPTNGNVMEPNTPIFRNLTNFEFKQRS